MLANRLHSTLKFLIWLAALTPLIASRHFISPPIFSKTIFFQTVIEIAFGIFVVYLVLEDTSNTFRKLKSLLKNPLTISILIFFLSLTLSAVFAQNTFYAFWGDAERGDGLFSLLHYLLFFIIAASIFERKDWVIFIKISLAIGFTALLYSWFPSLFIQIHFPSSLSNIRFESFLGNPAFSAAYFVLVLTLALLIYANKEEKKFWRYSGLFLVVLATLTIFASGIKGPIIGLLAGILFFAAYLTIKKQGLTRLVLAGILFLIILSGAILGLSKKDKILSDPSIQTRLITLKTSFEAFKEKPLFGWGLENYNVAYNKHYNPDHALYEEAWFDRAHNKIAEVAVTQGVVGLVSYLSMFAAALYLIITKLQPNYLKPVLSALLISYFVQNLSLFDTPVSYLMLFTTLGLIVSEQRVSAYSKKSFSNRQKFLALGVSATIVLLTVFSLYSYHYIPYRQSKIYRQAINTESGEAVVNASKDFLEPYNFLQPSLRFQLLESVISSNVIRNSEFDPLSDLAVKSLEEVISKDPHYKPQNHLLLAEFYIEKGKDNPALLKVAEKHLNQALELSPKRQDLYYLLAFNLAGQGRLKESIELNRAAINLNPLVAKAHYNLGLSLTLAGENYWNEAEEEFGKALEIGLVNPKTIIIENDYTNIATALEEMLGTYILKQNKEKVLSVSEKLKIVYTKLRHDPALIEGLNEIAKLTQEGKWSELLDILEDTK